MAKKIEVKNVVPSSAKGLKDVDPLVREFAAAFSPAEAESVLFVLADPINGARFCECHIRANKLVKLGTVDVPLDPEEQAEYRANRDLLENHAAFDQMKSDAKNGRTFSNIVAEYTTDFNADFPLKIIGGQHRYQAIRLALDSDVDELHGVKVYFGLDTEQRLDVQLISNTVIAVSSDLYDRIQETAKGPHLRDWCQAVRLLGPGQDFADRHRRGAPITVREARSFIMNFIEGQKVNPEEFGSSESVPVSCPSGEQVREWERIRIDDAIWKNAALREAGREFAELINAQRDVVGNKIADKRKARDYGEKARNYAVLSAWAFVAGMLQKNKTRLKRHYDLRQKSGTDPLNVAVLINGRHKSDPESYRGLGYRSDPKEQGRFSELFFLQAEKGLGINRQLVEAAIAQYHAKQALFEAIKAKSKVP